MKTVIATLSLVVVLAWGCSPGKKETRQEKSAETVAGGEDEGMVIQPQPGPDTLRGSLKAYAAAQIGAAHIRIHYYSPAVRGRVIWGGLVPFDNVWVTGAHRATRIDFGKDVRVGGVQIAAGSYALFTIPGKETWTVIINRNWNQHLADNYRASEDVVRLTTVPVAATTHQERLRYTIEGKKADAGEVVIHWETLQIAFPFEVLN